MSTGAFADTAVPGTGEAIIRGAATGGGGSCATAAGAAGKGAPWKIGFIDLGITVGQGMPRRSSGGSCGQRPEGTKEC